MWEKLFVLADVADPGVFRPESVDTGITAIIAVAAAAVIAAVIVLVRRLR